MKNLIEDARLVLKMIINKNNNYEKLKARPLTKRLYQCRCGYVLDVAH